MTTAKYKKYCPNVWLAETVEEYKRGGIAEVTTRHGKVNEHLVHNLIGRRESDGIFFYSITRVDGTNTQTVAQRKADKYLGWSASATAKSNDFYEKSNKHRDFLVLAEPIKIGHHSEKRHRKLIEDNWRNMGKSVEMSKKADSHNSKAKYWASRTNDINLSMPESIEYFETMLASAKEEQRQLKSGEKEREHSYSLPYATKRVKELTKKYEIALKLWSFEDLEETQDERNEKEKTNRKELKQERLNTLINEAGAFWAFGNKQYDEKAIKCVRYTSCGAGLIAPVVNALELMENIGNL